MIPDDFGSEVDLPLEDRARSCSSLFGWQRFKDACNGRLDWVENGERRRLKADRADVLLEVGHTTMPRDNCNKTI